MKTGWKRYVDLAWVFNAAASVLTIVAHRSWMLADNYSRLSIRSTVSRADGKIREPFLEHAESVLQGATQDFTIMIVLSVLLAGTAVFAGARPAPRIVGACISILALFMGLSYHR